MKKFLLFVAAIILLTQIMQAQSTQTWLQSTFHIKGAPTSLVLK